MQSISFRIQPSTLNTQNDNAKKRFETRFLLSFRSISIFCIFVSPAVKPFDKVAVRARCVPIVAFNFRLHFFLHSVLLFDFLSACDVNMV